MRIFGDPCEDICKNLKEFSKNFKDLLFSHQDIQGSFLLFFFFFGQDLQGNSKILTRISSCKYLSTAFDISSH